MTEPYNLTQLQNVTDIYDLTGHANTMSEGFLAMYFLGGLFIIIFVSSSRMGYKTGFSFAAFVTAFISILFRIMGWIPDYFMFGSFLIAAVALVLLRWGD